MFTNNANAIRAKDSAIFLSFPRLKAHGMDNFFGFLEKYENSYHQPHNVLFLQWKLMQSLQKWEWQFW